MVATSTHLIEVELIVLSIIIFMKLAVMTMEYLIPLLALCSVVSHCFCFWQSGHDAVDTKQSTADMTAFVQNLLQQMIDIINSLLIDFLNSNALDEMGSRIEELEQSINELRAEIGVESSPAPSVTESEKSPLHELKPEMENH
ncbi:Heat shock factor binding 1 [Spatholobus suberectus]|nr:Heat shock factor binding 1 [Spatholobus suberectus]